MRALLVAALLATAAPAAAYPQFQLATGALRCNQCHYAPAGGGLINGYGRDEAGDSISGGGNGAFLHGLWSPPSWIALGGDVRLAGLLVNEGATGGAEIAAFPMQADLYFRPQVGPVSLYLNVGLAGAARPDEPQVLSRLASREHYLMWHPTDSILYVRAGRFFAPYGLRVAEHTSYIRRWLGFNVLEETYGLSASLVEDEWELHVTGFVPDFMRPVGLRGSGGAALFEKRFGETAAAGAQARATLASDEKQEQAGLTGKLYVESVRVLFLGEVDLVHQSFDKAGLGRWQLVGYAGASWRLERGFMVQAILEAYEEDLGTKGVARSAGTIIFQWFPTAHVELSLYARLQIIGTGSAGSPLEQLLLQGHYYL